MLQATPVLTQLKTPVQASRSLPSAVHSIEPTYCEIPDDAVYATRPLPALPHTYWEIPDVEPNEDDDDALPFYAAATDLTLMGNGGSLSTYHDTSATTGRHHRPSPIQRTAMYGKSQSQRVTCYENAGNPSCHRGTSARGAASVPFYEGQGMVTYINAANISGTSFVTQYRASRSNGYESSPASQLTENQVYKTVPDETEPWTSSSNTWPWEISNGQLSRAHSVPAISTFPNTYWPRRESACRSSRSHQRWASLPTLSNTYHETTQTEVPLVSTIPNTYWPWDISSYGHTNTSCPRAVPTVPNTYWPWELAGEDITVAHDDVRLSQ
uniref:Uncharacterized protein n=1 Tax=Branchiostoma floridae TaxID=7739 RepID=C3XRL9_BRAFL|eukprot:XP_002613328.1 hypothetical protein BRAFLDRAFT_68295 [Branchiostoma floridae]